MKSASVSEAKNGLSALLDEVRRGETVLITNHGKPVARIESYRRAKLAAGEAEAELVRRGVADPPRAPLDVEGFWPHPSHVWPPGSARAGSSLRNAKRIDEVLGFVSPGVASRGRSG